VLGAIVVRRAIVRVALRDGDLAYGGLALQVTLLSAGDFQATRRPVLSLRGERRSPIEQESAASPLVSSRREPRSVKALVTGRPGWRRMRAPEPRQSKAQARSGLVRQRAPGSASGDARVSRNARAQLHAIWLFPLVQGGCDGAS
jgi:hypothetical protein